MNIALDLDGTLISCEPRQSAVLRAALLRLGATTDVRKVWELKRGGASTEQALVKLGSDPCVALNVAATWRDMVEGVEWLALDSLLTDSLETLELIRESGWSPRLITARSRREWVLPQLAWLGLLPFFDQVVIVTPGRASQEKARYMKEWETAAFFGDSESDFQAAEKANVPFYAVDTGQRDPEFLRSITKGTIYSNLMQAWRTFNYEHTN